ncbi:MAG: divalent-cation tolerance protein CutA [Candidatus Glassbacteria bacterium]|nr:divalent-cation tolerance protein CutA [Candidatus Glassbacteria bacterium]
MADSGAEGHFVVFVTTPGAEAAAALARTLVEERLAACGNVIGPVRSIYRWKGSVEDEGEALLVLKTRSGLFEALKARVLELHSYEVPEVIALTVAAGHGPYLDWIDNCTGR